MAPKQQVSLRLAPDWLERARRAVWWVGRRLTVTHILEEGAGGELDRLEAEYGPLEALRDRPPPRRPRRRDRRQEVRMVHLVVRLDVQLLRRLQAWGDALGVTYGGIVRDGADTYLRHLEMRYNKGRPFPPIDD
jgi:hypothetical protein